MTARYVSIDLLRIYKMQSKQNSMNLYDLGDQAGGTSKFNRRFSLLSRNLGQPKIGHFLVPP